MKGHMQDGKFHPHTDYKKGIRKSRSQKAKQQGVKIKPRKQRVVAKIPQPDGTETVLKMDNENFDEVTDPVERQQILDMLSKSEIEEWEGVVNSEIVKVKHEMLNGMPITTLRFANGEEWFEFESFDHQEKYVKKEKINVDENITGEFVEIDHPDIAGYITMESGSILFGERESNRSKRDQSKTQGVRLKRGNFNVGDIVMVSPDNQNEGYDSFRGKKLRITYIESDPSFYDKAGGEEEGLYSFETLDGKEVPNSLYDYELVKA